MNLEPHALEIGKRLRDIHMPHLTVMDPVFCTPYSDDICGYTRAADSAIWSGHALAAYCFQYAVTRDEAAHEAAETLLAGIEHLVDVTERGFLARCVLPLSGTFTQKILEEESGHGARYHSTEPYVWMPNTTRDQYAGVMFGLGVAFSMVEGFQRRIAELVTRMLDFCMKRTLPFTIGVEKLIGRENGERENTPLEFWSRPDLILSMLAVGRLCNPGQFTEPYQKYSRMLTSMLKPRMEIEASDTHRSYFKFNLAYINFYNLLRLDLNARYQEAFMEIREATQDHKNAHFDAITGAIYGWASEGMAAKRIELHLWDWLYRPRRDSWVDLREDKLKGPERGTEVVPVKDRPTTDFLWQRSPFLQYGGGSGHIEGAGIDFILPYWMARYHGLLT